VTLIQPLLADQALADDIESADPADGVALWWLGQSGFLLKSASGRLLFDPYLSDSLTKKYEQTDKPHVRMTARAIDPRKLRAIDVVMSSHNHTDHLDAETLVPILEGNPAAAFVIPEANREFVASRLSYDAARLTGLTDGASVSVGKFTVHAVPAAHSEIERDERGQCRYLGYVVRAGDITVYHSGDTLLYPDMAAILRPFAIDVALLPINGNRPERRVAGNLWGDEAAQLAHDMGARLAVPCHYNMFQFNTESPQLFIDSCQRLGVPHRMLQCGERLHMSPRSLH
jgi:L-ascorbate metabolism protein UlaG (beta-lactamase superfamily)